MLTAGANHTWAVDEKGRLVCWGDNRYGQLGDGSCDWYRPSRAPVSGGQGEALEVVSGGGHSCALLEDGQVTCWGWNSNGQIGDGDGGKESDRRPLPALVIGLPGLARSIAAGDTHTCVAEVDRKVWCWGDHGLSCGATYAPKQVEELLFPALALTAGGAHTCALLTGGSMACWGKNNSGQLGDGTTTEGGVAVTGH